MWAKRSSTVTGSTPRTSRAKCSGCARAKALTPRTKASRFARIPGDWASAHRGARSGMPIRRNSRSLGRYFGPKYSAPRPRATPYSLSRRSPCAWACAQPKA
ncbi:hypothetical protein Mterra_03895 [Calidithermus terrae]|uniref:Uncharacterized protein n=1 Tax=Calidithermus terrae TaxID=1408545 RepID=A0A399DW21_9DEIN|nr:hypothetical protein Mterra_03895 [Calidithermus terrae]